MGSNRPAEVATIHLRIEHTENAIAVIHTALHAAFTNTANIRKDARSLARSRVYELIRTALSKETLLAFDVKQINNDDLQAFFNQNTKALHSFYQSTEESAALTEADKAFFQFIISVFKALVIAHFNYSKLALHLENFTPDHQHIKLAQLANASRQILDLHKVVDTLHTLDTDIETRRKHLSSLDDKLRRNLHDEDIPHYAISYAERHKEIADSFNKLALHLKELSTESHGIFAQKNKIIKNQATEDCKSIEKDIAAYNESVIHFGQKLKAYQDTRVKLATTAHTLYDEIQGQINTYHQAATILNQAIQQRNTKLQTTQKEIERIGNHLKYLTNDIQQVYLLTDHIATPLDAILSIPHSTPEAFCNKLKSNKLFDGRHEAEWTTLASTITEQLQKVREHIELPCVQAFTAPMQRVKDQGKEMLAELRPYRLLSPENSITGYANEIIDSHDKALERQHNDIEAQLKNINRPLPVTYKRVLVHKTEDAAKPKHGFFRRHWKALSGGFLLGAGIAVATVLTAGIVPLVAGTAAAIGITVSALAGGTAGTLASTVACSIHDYYHSRYQIKIDEDQPDDPSNPARAPSAAPSTYARLAFRRSPAAIQATATARNNRRVVDFSPVLDGSTDRLFAPAGGKRDSGYTRSARLTHPTTNAM